MCNHSYSRPIPKMAPKSVGGAAPLRQVQNTPGSCDIAHMMSELPYLTSNYLQCRWRVLYFGFNLT